MSIIQQAAKRLEELRRAGIDVPEIPGNPSLQAHVVGNDPVASAAEARIPNGSALSEASDPLLRVAKRLERTESNARSQLRNIDLTALKAEGYLTPETPSIELVEELRAVKRPIIEYAAEAPRAGRTNGNLVLVTSAVPGEGKTYTAINLAMSIAMEVDHSVLLIDADVVRPAVMGRLGIQDERGLLDVLADSSLDLADFLFRTNVPKLTVLPAGLASAQSAELLASGAMERFLAEVAARYSDRIVIFDGPPLLATSESRVLASRMGQVLMVVESNKTPKSLVEEAFEAIETCDTVWCVLNKSTMERAVAAYAYRKS